MKLKELEIVTIVWLLLLLLFIAFGCKSAPKVSEFPGLENYQFQSSQDLEFARVVPQTLQFDVRFDGVTFGQAMSIISFC